MTQEEKWRRLKKPETVADYGLAITESELETFQEGREYLEELRVLTASIGLKKLNNIAVVFVMVML